MYVRTQKHVLPRGIFPLGSKCMNWFLERLAGDYAVSRCSLQCFLFAHHVFFAEFFISAWLAGLLGFGGEIFRVYRFLVTFCGTSRLFTKLRLSFFVKVRLGSRVFFFVLWCGSLPFSRWLSFHKNASAGQLKFPTQNRGATSRSQQTDAAAQLPNLVQAMARRKRCLLYECLCLRLCVCICVCVCYAHVMCYVVCCVNTIPEKPI